MPECSIGGVAVVDLFDWAVITEAGYQDLTAGDGEWEIVMPEKKPLKGRLEARAREVTPRGLPYKVGDDWLPKGEWVDVTHAQAEEIDALGWPVTVREKEKPADA